MLELPESVNMATQITETLKGKTITNVIMNNTPHKFAFYLGGDPDRFPEILTGAAITGARPNGGQVEILAGDRHMVFSDGANLKFYDAGAKRPKKHQMLLEFDDESALVITIQMYGGLFASYIGVNDNEYYIDSRDKPSPFSNDFDDVYFDGLVRSVADQKSISVKAFIATKQRIPGLGNGVTQDILFNARLNPQSHLRALKDNQIQGLYESIKEVLFDMAAKGGRDTEKDLFGDSGGYKTKLSAKTLQLPCPACGSEIIRKAYLGGNVYYCPHCQPIIKLDTKK